jgi:CBS domain-containing protein
MQQRESIWQLKIGSFKQIQLNLHVSLPLACTWITYSGYRKTESLLFAAGAIVAYVLSFLVHEFARFISQNIFCKQTELRGHMLNEQDCSDLDLDQQQLDKAPPSAFTSNLQKPVSATIYPFGVFYRHLASPDPLPRALAALAAPLASFLLALALFPFTSSSLEISSYSIQLIQPDPLAYAFLFSVALAGFSLLPIIPLSGGVLIASLFGDTSRKNRRKKAPDSPNSKDTYQESVRTNATARKHTPRLLGRLLFIGQVLALALVSLALYLQEPLFLISTISLCFLTFSEVFYFKGQVLAHALIASDVMVPFKQLTRLNHGMVVTEAAQIAVKSFQPVFPICFRDNFIGLAYRDDILSAATRGSHRFIGDTITTQIPAVPRDHPVEDVIQQFRTLDTECIVVMKADKCEGLLMRDKLMEYLMLKNLLESAHSDPEVYGEEL